MPIDSLTNAGVSTTILITEYILSALPPPHVFYTSNEQSRNNARSLNPPATHAGVAYNQHDAAIDRRTCHPIDLAQRAAHVMLVFPRLAPALLEQPACVAAVRPAFEDPSSAAHATKTARLHLVAISLVPEARLVWARPQSLN